MILRYIYLGAVWLILAIAVYGVSFFAVKFILPPHVKPNPPECKLCDTLGCKGECDPPLPPDTEELLIPPFSEREIKSASEIWQRWENLKKETDMPIE